MTGIIDHDAPTAHRRGSRQHPVRRGRSRIRQDVVAREPGRVAGAAGADVTEIAAITFTEAAAAELRARVRRTLEDVEAGRQVDWVDDSPEVRRRAGDALDRLDRATVCTLHAFAQRLLLAAPIEARLPPSVDVHDDISSALRFEDRWNRFERQLLDDDDLAGVMRMALTLGISSRQLQGVADTLGQNWDLVQEARDDGLIAADRAVDVDVSVLDIGAWVRDLDAIEALLARCTSADTDTLAAWIQEVALPLRALLQATAHDPYDLMLVATSSGPVPAGGRGARTAGPTAPRTR